MRCAPPMPDKRPGAAAFALILASHGLGAMSLLAILSAGPRLVAELGLTPVQIGALASVYSAALALSALPAGLVADRIGTRRALVAAAVLIAAGLGVASLAGAWPPLARALRCAGPGMG